VPVNQILRFGKFLAVMQPVAGDPNKTAVTAYMTLGIKAERRPRSGCGRRSAGRR
jgi:hypothetical protein